MWCVSVHSHVGWKYFLVFKILIQGNAASHDGCELDEVHGICTGVFGQVFFDDFAANPTNPSDKAGDSCGVEDRFDELVVGNGAVYLWFFSHRFCNPDSRSHRPPQARVLVVGLHE